MNACLNCGETTTNPKYCSRSCSTTKANTAAPKRSRTKRCAGCDDPIVSRGRRKFCIACSPVRVPKDWGAITKGEAATNDTQRYRRIREHARRVARLAGLLDECAVCGYSLHVECAHQKDISRFDDGALLSEINAVENLVGLCPNHHWEFDNHGAHSLRLGLARVGKSRVGIGFS